MGCCQSVDDSTGSLIHEVERSCLYSYDDEQNTVISQQNPLTFITAGIFSIPKLKFNVCPVCLSEHSFPVLIAEVIEQKSFSKILFPFCSIFSDGNLRVAAIASPDMFIGNNLRKDNSGRFFENILYFLNGKSTQKRILVIADNRDQFGFNINTKVFFLEFGDFTSDLRKFSIIIICTASRIDSRNKDILQNFVREGGGLFVIYSNENDNEILSEFGISFQNVQLNSDNYKIIGATTNSSFNLPSLIQKAKTILSGSPTFTELDDISYMVRIHMYKSKNWELLKEIKESYEQFISSHDDEKSNSVARFMVDEIARILPREYRNNKSIEQALINQTIKISTKPNEWTFTGLYLPPFVDCATYSTQSKCIVQIGAHEGNMRRFKQGEEMYCTQGGLVFVISETGGECTLSFNNVATVDRCPWRVFDCELCTFVISKETNQGIAGHTKVAASFKAISENISRILKARPRKKLFVVFSETNGNEIEDCYPIYIEQSMEKEIMNPAKASNSLQYFIERITRIFIPELSIDVETETSLCETISFVVMKTLFPDFDTPSIERSKLADCFIDYIKRFSIDAFSAALNKVLVTNISINSKCYMLVRELCCSCGTNVSSLFSDCIQLPEMFKRSLSQFS